MELGGPQRPGFEGGRYRPAVVTSSDRLLLNRRGVRMDEINPGVVFETGEEPAARAHVEDVPLHLRSPGPLRQQGHCAFQGSEARGPWRFLRTVVEKLHTDTNAEKSPPRRGRLDCCRPKPARSQGAAALAEITDSREHDPVGHTDIGRAAHETGVSADFAKRLFGRAQVADAVVDNGYEGLQNLPLHPGTNPAHPSWRGRRRLRYEPRRATNGPPP
jgi:hypothetical protein